MMDTQWMKVKLSQKGKIKTFKTPESLYTSFTEVCSLSSLEFPHGVSLVSRVCRRGCRHCAPLEHACWLSLSLLSFSLDLLSLSVFPLSSLSLLSRSFFYTLLIHHLRQRVFFLFLNLPLFLSHSFDQTSYRTLTRVRELSLRLHSNSRSRFHTHTLSHTHTHTHKLGPTPESSARTVQGRRDAAVDESLSHAGTAD